MKSGCLVLDDGWRIIREYRDNLSPTGQPTVGDRFLLWVLRNQANPKRCVQVTINPKTDKPNDNDFKEFPNHPGLEGFDIADRKFVAVAVAHAGRPPILQAFDSKWWGWRNDLAECGIVVHFLCPEEIADKHARKLG